MLLSAAATFNVAAAAAAAVQLIHNPNTGEHICPLCMKSFYGSQSRTTGQRHIQTAHGSNKFKCDVCGYISTRKDVLKSHIMKKHGMKNTVAKAMVDSSQIE